jgi:hypothetical protein
MSEVRRRERLEKNAEENVRYFCQMRTLTPEQEATIKSFLVTAYEKYDSKIRKFWEGNISYPQLTKELLEDTKEFTVACGKLIQGGDSEEVEKNASDILDHVNMGATFEIPKMNPKLLNSATKGLVKLQPVGKTILDGIIECEEIHPDYVVVHLAELNKTPEIFQDIVAKFVIT